MTAACAAAGAIAALRAGADDGGDQHAWSVKPLQEYFSAEG